MTNHIESCPFCDEYNALSIEYDDAHGYYILCFLCMAQGPTAASPDEAVELWNVTLGRQPDALE